MVHNNEITEKIQRRERALDEQIEEEKGQIWKAEVRNSIGR